MIQRIQSVWLLLAAAINVGLIFFGIYKADVVDGAITITKEITATNEIILLLIMAVTIILPFVSIFMFGNRKRQVNMSVLSIVMNIAFIAVAIMIVSNFKNQTPAPTDGTYLLGIFFPIIAIVFLILAIRGIRKDIKTIKSLDRLR